MAQGRSLILGLVSLLLVYASVLSFSWSADRELPVQLTLPGLEAEPALAMEAATARFTETGGSLEGIDLEFLKTELARAPLEEEPYLYGAVEHMAEGRIADAERLLEVAVRRDPRSSVARVLLLDLLARRGNARDSVVQIEVLTRLVPAQRAALQNTLVYLASMPSTRTATLETINDRSLKMHVLRRLAQDGASASMLLDAIGLVGDLDLGDEQASFVSSIVNPLLSAGDWEGGRRLWTSFNEGAFADGTLILDPTFSGAYGPPFGWEVRTGSEGYARLTNDGLVGEFYGRRQTVLAQQTVILEPGDYHVRVAAQDEGRGIQLAVRCKNGSELIIVALTNRNEVADFAVPAGCPALDIQLRGRPSDPPATSSFLISEIGLERMSS